ncbi:MAG: alpha/beta fold hydrolase, partial [Candidatus Thorarchaeota archaeon]
MKEAFAHVNGIKFCYEIHGNGDPVLLVHGFGAKKESWIAQTSPLVKHFKVIRFDNRGAGKSDRPDASYTMEIFADDINGLLDHLEIEKTHIIGWSLGGMIVQN